MYLFYTEPYLVPGFEDLTVCIYSGRWWIVPNNSFQLVIHWQNLLNAYGQKIKEFLVLYIHVDLSQWSTCTLTISLSWEIYFTWFIQNLMICLQGSFEIPRLKVMEHYLCKGLSIKIQHVTNHEILDYSKYSLKV